MITESIQLDTSGRQLIDVTSAVREFAAGQGDGLLNVFAPHATAGIAVIETGAGSEPDPAAILAPVARHHALGVLEEA